MAAKANKTVSAERSVEDFLAAVEPARRAGEARQLDDLFRRVTGFEPVVWGNSIIGYGRYHYRYETGREGDFLATGFAPRKAAISVHIMPGYADFAHILKDLGPHSTGRSCLYIRRLDAVDMDVLGSLIAAGLQDLGRRWEVLPR